MANRASAIIISKRHILLIHRIRPKQEFYVFPGGHIKDGESAEAACIREVLEETGLHIAWLQFGFDHSDAMKMAHYFFVQVHPGPLGLGGPEAQKQSTNNRYLLEWIPLAQVGRLNLNPVAVRDALAIVAVENEVVREVQDLAQRQVRLAAILSEQSNRL